MTEEHEVEVDVHPAPPPSGSVDQVVSVEPPLAELVIPGATGFRVRSRPVVAPLISSEVEPVRCAICGFPLLPTEATSCHRCRAGGGAPAQEDWEHAQEAWNHAVADQVAANVEYTAALQARDTAASAWTEAETVWADAERKSAEANGTAQQREVEWEQAQTAWEQAQAAHAELERHGGKPSSNLDGEDPG